MASEEKGTPKWVVYTGGLASIAAIVGVIIGVISFVNSQSLPEEPPTATISGLCQFALLGRTDLFYPVLATDNFRNKVSEQDFTQEWNDVSYIDQCNLTNVNISGDTATGDLSVQRSTGSSKYAVTFKKIQTQDSHGNNVYAWAIDDLQRR